MVFPDSIVPLTGLFGESLMKLLASKNIKLRIVFTYDPDRIIFINGEIVEATLEISKILLQ